MLKVTQSGNPSRWPGFEAGLFSVQDFAAKAVCRLTEHLHPKKVLDLCAAPGGKSSYFAECFGPETRVLAIELQSHRLKLLQNTKDRLALSNLEIKQADTTEISTLPEEQFELVVLDPPCSALGTLQKHPEIKLRPRPEVERLAQLQAQMLEVAAKLTAPGGALLYSVCTLTEDEGPEQIKHFLQIHPEFSIAEQQGISAWLEKIALNPQTRRAEVQIWPHLHGGDGFYACLLSKEY